MRRVVDVTAFVMAVADTGDYCDCDCDTNYQIIVIGMTIWRDSRHTPCNGHDKERDDIVTKIIRYLFYLIRSLLPQFLLLDNYYYYHYFLFLLLYCYIYSYLYYILILIVFLLYHLLLLLLLLLLLQYYGFCNSKFVYTTGFEHQYY